MLCDGRTGVLNCLFSLTWRSKPSAWNCPGSFYPILRVAEGHFKPMSAHQQVAKLTKRKTRDEEGRENVLSVSLGLQQAWHAFRALYKCFDTKSRGGFSWAVVVQNDSLLYTCEHTDCQTLASRQNYFDLLIYTLRVVYPLDREIDYLHRFRHWFMNIS